MLATAASGLACQLMGSTAPIQMPAAELARGEALYGRCATCHLPDGSGIERVFPPLSGRWGSIASTEIGRTYLTLVTTQGLVGEIHVDGIPYRGAMPAQGLEDTDAAAVLNYVMVSFGDASGSFRPFSADEISAIRARHGGASPNDVRRMRADLVFEGTP